MGKQQFGIFVAVGLMAASFFASPEKIEAGKLKFDGVTDKSPVSYRPGEKMKFVFNLEYGQELPEGTQFYVQWTRSGDDGLSRTGFEPIAEGRPVKIATSIDRPGFVRVQAVLTDVTGRRFNYMLNNERMASHVFEGGAGAAVDDILPANEEPADFDAFWAGCKGELAKVPLNPVVVDVPTNRIPAKFAATHRLQAVTVPCAGPRPVTGFLIVPAGAKARSLPVVVSFDGYGEGGQGAYPDAWMYEVANAKIHFHVNAHGYELMREDAYYKDFFAKIPSYAFDIEENMKPETCYFHGMALRVVRAFDFVKTLPEWNGRDLIAQGGSQGGLQTSWAGSLVEGLTECRPSVTWCSDIDGTSVGRQGGWRPDFRPGLAYYDTVFHARRIPASCRLEITRAGLGDYVCPPSGLAAQYNAANCPKSIVWMQNSTHMFVPSPAHTYTNAAPKGCGRKGVAPSAGDTACKTDFVKAEFNGKWQFDKGDGFAAIEFGGRANLRKGRGAGGADLPVMQKVSLRGVLVAEKAGEAVVGVGADWWWTCVVNGKEIVGRTRAMPGGNGKASFEKTDWLFRVPVEAGENEVRLDIVLGEHGTVAIGAIQPEEVADGLSTKLEEDYAFYTENYPAPETVPFKPEVSSGGKVRFRTAQPYPAGIEYKLEGDKEWRQAWDASMSCKHKVVLPLGRGEKCTCREIQHVFLGGWSVLRGEEMTLAVEP